MGNSYFRVRGKFKTIFLVLLLSGAQLFSAKKGLADTCTGEFTQVESDKCGYYKVRIHDVNNDGCRCGRLCGGCVCNYIEQPAGTNGPGLCSATLPECDSNDSNERTIFTYVSKSQQCYPANCEDTTEIKYLAGYDCILGPDFWPCGTISHITLHPMPTDDPDGDGYDACEDCVEGNAAIYPGAVEECDGLDNNCDGKMLPCEELLFRSEEQGNVSSSVCSNCCQRDPDQCPDCPKTENSVDLVSGTAMAGPVTDFSFQGTHQRIEFTRYYFHTFGIKKPLGYGWNHNFNSWLKLTTNVYGWVVKIGMMSPDGTVLVFRHDNIYSPNRSNRFISTTGYSSTVEYDPANPRYIWKKFDGSQYIYNTSGDLIEIDYSSGQRVQLIYTGGLLSQIKDPVSGRGAAISYDGSNNISQIQAGADTFTYSYNSENLSSVRKNGETLYTYLYGIIEYPHNLTSVMDREGKFIEEITYDLASNRAVTVSSPEEMLLIEYGSTPGITKVTDLNRNTTNTIYYDPATHALLASGGCSGSCASSSGGEYLYDGNGNKALVKNNNTIQVSTYDQYNNLVNKTYLSSLSKASGSVIDDFQGSQINQLYWRAIAGEGGSYEFLPGHLLQLKAIGQNEIDFSSKDRITLDGDFFEVNLNYKNPPPGSDLGLYYGAKFKLMLISTKSEDNFVKLSIEKDGSGYYYYKWLYKNKDRPPSSVPTSDGSRMKRCKFSKCVDAGFGGVRTDGQLIIRRQKFQGKDTFYLSVRDGMTAEEVPVFNNSESCPEDCDFSGPFYIKFGLYNAYTQYQSIVGVDKIEVNGSEVERYEAEAVPNQPSESYSYYTKDAKLPPHTLVQVGRPSLWAGTTTTKTIYDYDTDTNDNYNENPSPYLRRIIKAGYIDSNNDGAADSFQKTYQCFQYGTTALPGKITREYQPSANASCSAAAYTDYEYYTSHTADSSTGDLRYKREYANGLILDTTYLAYDASGNPTIIQDPNGIITEYQYDHLGRITRQAVDTEGGSYVTEYIYSGENLAEIHNPSQTTIKYLYNGPGGYSKLTAMERYKTPSSAELIEKINYQYGYITDGKWTQTEYSSPSLPSARKLYVEDGETIYNDGSGLRRKYQKVIDGGSGSGQSQVITLNIFDDNGNPLYKIVDPEGPDRQITTYTYNQLNQLIAATDPLGHETSYAYDQHGNLSSISAPNGDTTQVTSYVYDDFGRLIKSQSPDAGITIYGYDPANNLVSKTDARGITVSYLYDSLNRLSKIVFPNDPDIEYFYDGTAFALPDGATVNPPDTNALGRLTGVKIAETTDDPYARYSSYEYDSRGNIITSFLCIVGSYSYGASFTTSYEYDPDGNLTQITYPSGRVVQYPAQESDPDRVASVSAQINGEDRDIASGIQYYPFGDIKGFNYGSGLSFSNQLDQRYFPQRITAGGVLDLVYNDPSNPPDRRGNIKSIIDNLDSDRSQTFSYDLKDQLVLASPHF